MATVRNQPATGPSTSWVWPDPPRSNRYGATVTEVRDLATDGRRVAVIEGAVWPPVGTELSVFEDQAHTRRGTVARVELQLENQAPARVVVWADLSRDPD